MPDKFVLFNQVADVDPSVVARETVKLAPADALKGLHSDRAQIQIQAALKKTTAHVCFYNISAKKT